MHTHTLYMHKQAESSLSAVKLDHLKVVEELQQGFAQERGVLQEAQDHTQVGEGDMSIYTQKMSVSYLRGSGCSFRWLGCA